MRGNGIESSDLGNINECESLQMREKSFIHCIVQSKKGVSTFSSDLHLRLELRKQTKNKENKKQKNYTNSGLWCSSACANLTFAITLTS